MSCKHDDLFQPIQPPSTSRQPSCSLTAPPPIFAFWTFTLNIPTLHLDLLITKTIICWLVYSFIKYKKHTFLVKFLNDFSHPAHLFHLVSSMAVVHHLVSAARMSRGCSWMTSSLAIHVILGGQRFVDVYLLTTHL